MNSENTHGDFVEEARELLSAYGRDYALGALGGLAARNLVEVELPGRSEAFYPIVKIHEMALRELEDIFYARLQTSDGLTREDLIGFLVEEKVWE